jgi:hypothetical protein
MAVAAGLLAPTLGAEAQGQPRRIGVLSVGAPATPEGERPFHERMRELGWVYGRDFVIEHRAYGTQIGRVPELADELIRAGAELSSSSQVPPTQRKCEK